MKAPVGSSELQREAIYLVGAGAQTAVGATCLSIAAAVRCGISAFTEHPFIRDKRGERMIVARADWLDVNMPLNDRLLALAAPAASEALQPIVRVGPGSRVKVHLALSPQSSGGPAEAQRLADALVSEVTDARLEEQVAVVVEGHAGGFLALQRATEDLRSGSAVACLVGGVDSYMTADLLEAADYAGRLHSRHHSWGFTPGEGAGFCLLATGATAGAWGLVPLAELQAVATARESKLLGTRTINVGEGLTAAFRGVLSTGDLVHHTYCDLNGEIYRADELAFAICRTSEQFVDAASFTAPATCWGDVGAASAPLALALATATWSRGYAAWPVVLAWASSAHAPLRGAARLKQVVTPED